MSGEILVVEDDPDVRRLLEFKLSSDGYDVVEVGDGEEAWRMLRDGQVSPDVVLLDVMIPGMDGFAVLRRMKEDDRLSDVPVVMLTAVGDEDKMVDAMEMGADDYVTKPFSPAVVSARLERMM